MSDILRKARPGYNSAEYGGASAVGPRRRPSLSTYESRERV